MKLKNRYEVYLLPVLIFIFIFNYHYFGFYKNDYTFNQSIINPDFRLDQYDRIMQYHPYSIIYQYAKKYAYKDNRINFVLLKKNDQNYDYTSTYYLNLNNKSSKKTKAYISELSVYNNYYFYPKKVKSYFDLTGKEFLDMNLKKNDLIISDTEIHPAYVANYSLKRVMFDREGNPLVRINRKMEDIYYLYIVM